MQIPQSDIFRLSFGKSDSLFGISIHPKTGKTMLTYYTDNPDCEHDWFEIDETVEVVLYSFEWSFGHFTKHHKKMKKSR
jgi:hypothetical protein